MPLSPRRPPPGEAEAARRRARRPRPAARSRSPRPSSARTPPSPGCVVALLCRGHVLLEGVPGVAKTLLVRGLAAALDAGHDRRVQFTPDLMPGDITGSLVYDARTARVRVPRRARCSPTCCSPTRSTARRPRPRPALLEAMEERQVTVDGTHPPAARPVPRRRDPEPVEYEGTYPLPEAQLDRFLLKLHLPVPERDDEIDRAARHRRRLRPARHRPPPGSRAVAGAEHVEAGSRAVRQVSRLPRGARATSSTSAGRPGSSPSLRWARRRAARPRCSTPPRPGPGCPVATS